eukprot:TRINITY_DN2074_c1_g4_i1.p1 TRINITY_DN2074_c1_g4~~TRINITY_DN2074_c1_g4_i1.p1  ORF type:complete len:864 (+),score=190.46 TRINITY_DN2074_c1_g4_i1:267-2858(+)
MSHHILSPRPLSPRPLTVDIIGEREENSDLFVLPVANDDIGDDGNPMSNIERLLSPYRTEQVKPSHHSRQPSLVDIYHSVGILENENLLVVRGDGNDGPQTTERRHTVPVAPSITRKMWMYTQEWAFLAILGVLSAAAGLFTDWCILHVYNAQVFLAEGWVHFVPLNYVIWVTTSLIFATMAVFSVQFISSYAAGSGIPEMRSILGGVYYPEYLSVRTLIAKFIGLICAFGGGFNVGKEGPYVHISSIIANQLSRFPLFREIHRNEAKKLNAIAAGCAVGVSTSFGAPIGGVLFSVEVTSTYYFVDNLWKGFLCAACGALLVSLMGSVGMINLFSSDLNHLVIYKDDEIVMFMVTGLVGGLIAALYVKCVKEMIERSIATEFLRTRLGHLCRSLAVSLLCSALGYWFVTLRVDQQSILDYLLAKRPLDLNDQGFVLGSMLLAQFVLSVLSISVTAIPCGVYTPVFILGAIYGRIVGEVLILFGFEITASTYAIVGAAAIAAGVTRTISTAVIVVELTGQSKLILPILAAVLTSMAVGRMLTASVYDVLLEQKGLPYMPRFKLDDTYSSRARDVMSINFPFFTMSSSTEFIQDVVLRDPERPSFPVVENEDNMILLGAVMRSELDRLIDEDNHPAVPSDDEGNAANGGVGSSDNIGEDSDDDFDSFLGTSGSGTGPQGLKMKLVADETDVSDMLSQMEVEREEEHEEQKKKRAEEGEVEENERKLQHEHLENLQKGEASPMTPRVRHSRNGQAVSPRRVRSDSLPHYLDTSSPAANAVAWVITTNQGPVSERKMARVDPSILHISEDTPMARVHFLFTMLGLRQCYVTSRGRLQGVIDKEVLLANVNHDSLKDITHGSGVGGDV